MEHKEVNSKKQE